MSEMDQVRVDVRPSPGAKMKIVWCVNNYYGFAPYNIDKGMVLEYSARTRMALGALVAGCMRSLSGRGELIKQVANEGSKLFAALLYDADSANERGEIKDWLARHSRPARISFVVDGQIHIPWHLVYDSDPSGLPEDDATSSDPDTY